MATATLPTRTNNRCEQGNSAMKLLAGGATMMILMAGIVVEREANPLSPLSVFFLAGIGGTFTALATYLLAGKKNDSQSLAAHMLGNVAIAVSLGTMAAMHGAPRMTGIPADDVFQIVFVGGISGISGMAFIGALRGLLTVKALQQIIATMCGLEVPSKSSRKKQAVMSDDTNGLDDDTN